MQTTGGSADSRDGFAAALLVAPAALYIVALFVIPVGYVLILSVTDPSVSLANFRRLFTVPLYADVMLNTFKTSLVVTLGCTKTWADRKASSSCGMRFDALRLPKQPTSGSPGPTTLWL